MMIPLHELHCLVRKRSGRRSKDDLTSDFGEKPSNQDKKIEMASAHRGFASTGGFEGWSIDEATPKMITLKSNVSRNPFVSSSLPEKPRNEGPRPGSDDGPPQPGCMDKCRYEFHTAEEHHSLRRHMVRPAHIWGGVRAHTTSHGIPHIDNARGFIKKGFWSLIFMVMIAFLIYNLQSLTRKYLAYDVDVIIQMQHERELIFPAVTICNMNPIRKSKLNLVPELKVLFDTVEYVNSSVSTEGEPVPGSEYSDRILARESFRLEEKVAEILADIPYQTKQEIGYQPWDFIWDCQYSGYDCWWQEFSRFFNPIHGNCFIFNSGWKPNQTLKVSHKTGRRYGLKLILNVDQGEYVPEVGESAGVRVVVHPQARMPFPQDEGIVVSPGALTSIGIRQLTVSREADPYGNCTAPDQRNISRNVYEENFNVNYSATACYKTCLQRYLIQLCNCGDPMIPLNGTAFSEGGTHACRTGDIQEDDCKYKVTLDFNTDQLECPECFLPCKELSFQPELSTVQWPSDVYQASFQQQFDTKLAMYNMDSSDPDKYRRNILKLEVYYEEFNYENIDERPSYGGGQFASDIGGVLGLWIGWSIMTAFEFIELFLDLCVLRCCVRRRENRPGSSRQVQAAPQSDVASTDSEERSALAKPTGRKENPMPPPYQSLRFV